MAVAPSKPSSRSDDFQLYWGSSSLLCLIWVHGAPKLGTQAVKAGPDPGHAFALLR